MEHTRILIVDDHEVVRRGIHMFLETVSSIKIVGEAANNQDAVNKAESLQPDVVLMDLVLSQEDGVEAIAEIKRRVPHVKVLVLTTFGDEPRFKAAMEAGADGFLLKDANAEDLVRAIQAARHGQKPIHPGVTQYLVRSVTRTHEMSENGHLTARELEVLELAARGFSNRAIAQALNLSAGTVKVHISHILGKLKVSNRTEAVVQALHLGLIPPFENGQGSPLS